MARSYSTLRDLSNDLSIDFAYIQELCGILSDIDSFDDTAANKVGALVDAISLIAERAEGKVETAAKEAHHG